MTSTQEYNQQVLQPMLVSAMGLVITQVLITSMGAMAAGLSLSAGFGEISGGGGRTYRSAAEELAHIKYQLFNLEPELERYRDSVVSGRKHRAKLMKDFGLTVTPSMYELRHKYPQLYHMEENLTKAEKRLAQLELRELLLRKRKKELQQALGIREKEEEMPRHVYPAMKKFQEPVWRED